MVLTVIWALSVAFLVVRFGVAWANALSAPVLRTGRNLPDEALVAVLIPARNEAANLPRLLSQLSALPGNLRIWVLDDHSEDETAAVVKGFALHNQRIELVSGQPLPAGWLGKNWACHQLAMAAQAHSPSALLFLDADVAALSPDLIPALQQQSKKLKTSLLSVFPDQKMHTLGEWLTVPLMHYLLLSLLPLWLVRYAKFPSMAAANGQCMWFASNDYYQYKWHEKVKNIVIEDIEIMRKVKDNLLKGMAFCGGNLIHTRMYSSFHEGVNGFTKNLLAGFGGSIFGLLSWLFLLATPLALLPFVALPVSISASWLVAGILLLMLGIRVAISRVAGQSISKNLLFHVPQMAILSVIAALSIFRHYTGTQQWKGRTIPKRPI